MEEKAMEKEVRKFKKMELSEEELAAVTGGGFLEIGQLVGTEPEVSSMDWKFYDPSPLVP